jgi:hypothetical protein
MPESNQAQGSHDQIRNYLHSEMRDFPRHDLSRNGRASISLDRQAPHYLTLIVIERKKSNTCVFVWLLSKMRSEEKMRRNKELRRN